MLANFVVYGKRDTSPVRLGSLGARGVPFSNYEDQFAAAGDVNGDGCGDILGFTLNDPTISIYGFKTVKATK